jgi:hypothetical protein
MARPKDPDREKRWRQRCQRQAASSLPVTAFCAREGVSTASFYAWKRRLAAAQLTTVGRSPLFVPVCAPVPSPDPGPSPTRGVVLELPHRIRLRLDGPPDPEWLGRLVAAMAALPDREAHP